MKYLKALARGAGRCQAKNTSGGVNAANNDINQAAMLCAEGAVRSLVQVMAQMGHGRN